MNGFRLVLAALFLVGAVFYCAAKGDFVLGWLLFIMSNQALSSYDLSIIREKQDAIEERLRFIVVAQVPEHVVRVWEHRLNPSQEVTEEEVN